MNPPASEKLLHAAIRAALLAGEEILKVYTSDFAVEFKADKSPLTLADQNANNIIAETLAPFGIPILSEEGRDIPWSERKNWETLWIVDPLDGTKEFVKKNGEFTVNIALIEKQKSILGVIYQPTARILYFALHNRGSFRCDRAILTDSNPEERNLFLRTSKPLPLVSERTDYAVVASRSHLSEETEAFLSAVKTTHKKVDIVSIGSSLKFCLVAEGSADLYPRFGPTNEWDTAAGQAIVECAGGEVIDCLTNQQMLYNREEILNASFIARRKH